MGKALPFCLLLMLISLLVNACAPVKHGRDDDPWQALRQPDGSVLWLDEYRFVPPPEPWQFFTLDDRDYSLALYKACDSAEAKDTSCGAMIAYAEEPFGFSRELEPRAHEFLKRFLWAAQLVFSTPRMMTKEIGDRPALVVEISGQEPVKHLRMQSRIIFMHRGERVVAFWANQWRGAQDPFSPDDFAAFDRFVESFKFVRPSFYETLQQGSL
jgi:hypothetical protein